MGKIFKFKKPTKNDVINEIKNALLVMVGTFVLALGTELFIIPSGLDTGGLSGIAVCFKYAGFPFEPELVITILTWLLFFLGLIVLGWQFSVKTLISTIFYPVALYFIKYLSSVFPWLLVTNSESLKVLIDGLGEVTITALVPLLSAVFGGVFVGAGCAITFLGGGSTGGVDIITFVLCKYIKALKSSVSFFMIDAIIVVVGFFFMKDIVLCLEGVLSAFIAAIVIDKLFLGSSKSFVANIVTEKYEEITKDIIEKLDRTTSLVDIQGGYTKESKKMIMFSFSMRDYSTLIAIVSKHDKRAFMTISKAHDISGEGFTFKPSDKIEKEDIEKE
ncbi:MAG: YitT family protein [Bacillales bacterium]|nr:YitT family protein [Bacillales bacterium]